MIKIVDGKVRATDVLDMPLSTKSSLWKDSKLAMMLQFGGGVTIAAVDEKLEDFARRARSLSATEKDFWTRLRTDRERLKRTQDSYEEVA